MSETVEPALAETRRESRARTELIKAAETLFATRGIDGVSLREITREAGQKNTTALQYHFRGREGLLRALVEKHTTDVSIRREALLDHVTGRGAPSVHDVAKVLVEPLVAELHDLDGGPEFLQVAAQLVNRADRLIDPDSPVGALVYDEAGSLAQWAKMAEPHLPPGAGGSPLHRRFAAIRFAHLELGRRAQTALDGASHDLFASQLVDLVGALLTAELSPETQRLLGERRAED